MIMNYTIQELEDYIERKAALNQEKLDSKQLDEPWKSFWSKYARISTDVSATNLVYLAGFDEITDGTIKASEALTNWVRNIDRKRSANFMGGICAVFLTATLQNFTEALVKYWFENCEDSEEHIQSIEIGNFDELKTWISPTAKSGRWFTRLGKLLGYKPDPELITIIEDMLKCRTTAAHEGIDGIDTPTGEQIKLWSLATYNLISELIQNIKEKIDKRDGTTV